MKLEIKDLTFSYDSKLIFNKLNLELAGAGLFEIRGKSGSGKTTLFKLILGKLKADDGNVLFDNKSNLEFSADELSSTITYVNNYGEFGLSTLSLLDNVSIYENYDRDLFYKLVKLLNADSYLNKPMFKLSGGQKKKAGLILSLVKNSPCIILDEPFSFLDKVSRKHLQEILQNYSLNHLVLYSNHAVCLKEIKPDLILDLNDLNGTCFLQGKESDEKSCLANINCKLLFKSVLNFFNKNTFKTIFMFLGFLFIFISTLFVPLVDFKQSALDLEPSQYLLINNKYTVSGKSLDTREKIIDAESNEICYNLSLSLIFNDIVPEDSMVVKNLTTDLINTDLNIVTTNTDSYSIFFQDENVDVVDQRKGCVVLNKKNMASIFENFENIFGKTLLDGLFLSTRIDIVSGLETNVIYLDESKENDGNLVDLPEGYTYDFGNNFENSDMYYMNAETFSTFYLFDSGIMLGVHVADILDTKSNYYFYKNMGVDMELTLDVYLEFDTNAFVFICLGLLLVGILCLVFVVLSDRFIHADKEKTADNLVQMGVKEKSAINMTFLSRLLVYAAVIVTSYLLSLPFIYLTNFAAAKLSFVEGSEYLVSINYIYDLFKINFVGVVVFAVIFLVLFTALFYQKKKAFKKRLDKLA